ncbi:cell wall hydrolase [Boseaceae bacterium BT-24-1]|nr:cell wall hydrolase [Boseaceae bacterium BT-24-1]
MIDATLANTAENDRRQQQDLTGKAIMSGAWGGDRAGVAKAELGRQQKMAADTTLAGLNSQNFAQAMQAFQQQQGVDLGARQNDATRALSAGTALSGLGSSMQDSALKDAMAQIQAGGVRQQNNQATADAGYEDWLSQQAYPFQSQSWLANILGGIGSGAGSTSSGSSTTKTPGSSNIGQYLGAGISLASAMFSDERLKDDIEQIGETFDGQPIYRYRFKGSPKTEIGLMAQDVEDVHPEAVGDFGGIKMVDYERATDDAARPGFADGGVPYTGRVKSRIPDTSPMKFRAALMGAQAAMPSASMKEEGGQSDYGKMGSQLGGLLKGVGSSGPMDISPVSFGSSGVGSIADAFSGAPGGMGLVYARGGVVPDMERGTDGAYRLPRASGGIAPFFDPEPIGGPIPYAPEPEPVAYSERDAIEPAWRSARPGGNVVHTAENDMDTMRLERALGMVQHPQDINAIIRTVYGEAAGESPEGKRAVASVIKNRAAESGMTPSDVVTAKGQFEPWMTEAGQSRMMNMGPGKFQQTAKELDSVFRNLDDPTGGATHFYAPKAQASLGRDAPKWDDGTGADIGAHRFFAHGYGGAPATTGLMARSAPSGGVAPAAYAAEDENNPSGRTTAFDAVKPTGVLPLSGPGASAAPAAAKPDPDKGFGLGYLPKDVQMALIAAGLGMMGSRGRGAGQQIGEGGLAGLQFYLGSQQAKAKLAAEERDRARQTLTQDRDYGLRERSAANADKSLLQRAQEARERLGYERERIDLSKRQAEESERRNKALEEKTKFTIIPGQGTDAEGNTVAGSYKMDVGTGEMVFQPGVVTGAKPRDPEAELTRKSEFERLKGLDEAAEGARGIRQSVNNLRELRKGVSYEGMPLAGPASKIAGMAGYGGGQALESAATNFKLDLSTKLKGAISDKEQAMLNSATPGLGMSDDAANQTLATYEGVAERAIERQRFYQTWRARNKTLSGADDAWDRYVNENPVVQADKDGKLSLSRQNLGNWQKYVAAPVKAPTSKAEYDKLEPGAKYRDPNGVERTKGGVAARASGGAVVAKEPTGLEEPGSDPEPDFFGSARPAQPYREGQRSKDQSGRALVYHGGRWRRREN